MKALRRLEAGQFSIEHAKTIEQLTAMNEQDLFQCLINVDKPLEALPAVELSAEQAVLIKYGQSINLPALPSFSPGTMQGAVRMYHAAVFLGLGEMLLDGKLAPKKLFNMNNRVEMRFIASVKSGDVINRVFTINILISTPYRGNQCTKKPSLDGFIF